MKKLILKMEAAFLLVSIVLTSTGCNSGEPTANTAANTSPANAVTTAQSNPTSIQRFSEDELDELFARIALFPDPLLAQIIPASTFVDQLNEAQATLGGSVDESRIDNQRWDVSVKSVAHYPQVLKMMTDDEAWTASVGQAYVLQPDDVGKSIQRLRAEAMDVGNLVTTPQQEIVDNGEVINIYPAQEKVIYVPQYNSETVYTEPPQEESDGVSTGAVIATAAIAFGAGLLIGSWLNNDYDYYGRGVYYHGWNSGPAWVNVNRAYVNVNHVGYVNRSYSSINVNRNVVNHRSAATYRQNLTLNSSLRRGRVDQARINNINRAPNGRVRTNAGRHLGQNKVNNLDRNRVNDGRNPNRGGNPNRGANPDRGGNRGGSPRVNQSDRSRSGGRNNGSPNVQNRQAPAQRQQRSSPQRSAPQRSSGGRRRG